MKVPNVEVLSRRGELLGIWWDRPGEGERKGSGLAGGGRPEGETHHVVGDVHAEDSGFVVHKRRRVEGEGGHADVDHVAVLLGQREGRSRERRLLVLPDVVKLALSEERTQLWDVSPDQTFRFSHDSTVVFYLHLQVDARSGNVG